MDCFSHFSKIFCLNIKCIKKTPENSAFNFYSDIKFKLFLSSRVFLSDMKFGVNIVGTLLLIYH